MTEFPFTPDGTAGRIASRQHGVVTAAQLVEAGIDKDGVAWRVSKGRLHRLHRGVYAVGHRSLSWRGRWLGAARRYTGDQIEATPEAVVADLRGQLTPAGRTISRR